MPPTPAPRPTVGDIAEDRSGATVGLIVHVRSDPGDGQPAWLTVTHGRESLTTSIAPAHGARVEPGKVVLACSREQVLSAPQFSDRSYLGAEHIRALTKHYRPGEAPLNEPDGHAGAGDGAMFRAEQQLRINTVSEPYARARVRVYEQTEEVLVPVTVTRQWAQIEYVDLRGTTAAAGPIVDADRAGPPTPLRPADRAGTPWVTLFVDHPVVTRERQPVERVRLSTSWVAGERTINEALSREQVVLETSDKPAAPRPPFPR